MTEAKLRDREPSMLLLYQRDGELREGIGRVLEGLLKPATAELIGELGGKRQ
jgi:hypothetical protein